MEYLDWINKNCGSKLVTVDDALAKIKSGSRVFISSACGEPQHLIHSMVKDNRLQDIMIYQMLSFTLANYVDDASFLRRFSLKLFFISQPLRKAAFEGKIDYIPAYLSRIPEMFNQQRIGIDVALIQVSPPDKFGYCSLGISVDITRSGMENAKMVIAQINPKMPRTWGDSIVHVNDIDFLVDHEEPVVTSLWPDKDNRISQRIGHFVSQLVDDGDTLQIGFGQLPNTILKYLNDKKDLGIHTQVITDGFLPLFQQNVITNRKKTLLPGRVVASLCMGSKNLYQYVDNNPMFYFRSSEFVSDPTVTARNDNLISISSALEVDLTGQVCSDSVGYRFYSGIGDQVDFLRGSAMSKGGFSIIAIPSTAQNGKVSRIVSHLSEGAGVATTRGDVNFVVTEYGIAELQGKGIYQRVMELAQIAHPKFRDSLIEEAKKHHYIFSDQLPPANEDLIFLEDYKTFRKMKSGKTIEFRPILPSDEFSSRNFFYSLQDQTIYSRFFHRIKIFSREMVQQQWAHIDYRKNMSIIGLVKKGGNKAIMSIGSYAYYDDDTAEIAFVVHEAYQGMGIASYLLIILEEIAKKNNYKKFIATTLRQNKAMMHVFKKRYPNAKMTHSGGSEIDIEMEFTDAVAEEENIDSTKQEKRRE